VHDSTLDLTLVQTYRETDYRVFASPPFTLRVGQRSAELAAAHRRHGVAHSAYVTACNPFSQALDHAANAARHASLGRQLAERGLPAIEGLGKHPNPRQPWPGEPSYLVLGLDLAAAMALGR
jgi:hypothetical protein